MLGKLDPNLKDVTIVGAGVSGLLAAYYLDRAGYRVQLLEAQSRVGGLIATRSTKHGIVEAAAHSVPATPLIRELCRDLGVELCPIRPEAKARWIYRNGKPRRFPLKLIESLTMFFRAYFVLAPRKDPESLTLEEWTLRFLGARALQYLVTPFVRGIYGTNPAEISVAAAFPALCVPRGSSLISFFLAKIWRNPSGHLEVNRAIPKIPRGEISAPRAGMGSLTDALESRLSERLGDRFQRGSGVERLDAYSGNLIVCVPAEAAARLIAPECAELSKALSDIRYSPLSTTTVFLKRSSLHRVPRGLGILMPENEGRKCLGILYNSSSFAGRAEEDVVSVTIMMDGQMDGELRKTVFSELDAIFGLKEEPLEIHHQHCDRAVPKYDSHLLSTWTLAERTWCSHPGRILFGNYTGQVSIRGMAELANRLIKKP